MSNTHEDVRRMFDEVLKTDTTTAETLPDLQLIHKEGGRLTRRRLVAAGLAAGGLALVGGMASGGFLGSASHSDPGQGSVLAGSAATPSKPPTDLGTAAADELQSQLVSVLRKHLPAGLTLEPESGQGSTFTLRHVDGATTTLGALAGLQELGGGPKPCPKYGTDCRAVMLPDGSRGWASKGLDGRSVSVALYTLNGQAFGLTDGDSVAVPGTKTREAGAPMTEAQLISLVEQPDVYAVLEKVPTDQVSADQTGKAYRP